MTFFLAKLIQSATEHMWSNFLNVWILPTFAGMNICPNVALLTWGSAKFLKSQGHCLGRGGHGGGNDGHNLVLKPFCLKLSSCWTWFPFIYFFYAFPMFCIYTVGREAGRNITVSNHKNLFNICNKRGLWLVLERRFLFSRNISFCNCWGEKKRFSISKQLYGKW